MTDLTLLRKFAEQLRRYFSQYFGVQFGNSNECFRGGARFATTLLPILEGAHGDAKEGGELGLRDARFFPRANDRIGLRGEFAANAPSFDGADAFKNFLADITRCLSFRRSG